MRSVVLVLHALGLGGQDREIPEHTNELWQCCMIQLPLLAFRGTHVEMVLLFRVCIYVCVLLLQVRLWSQQECSELLPIP